MGVIHIVTFGDWQIKSSQILKDSFKKCIAKVCYVFMAKPVNGYAFFCSLLFNLVSILLTYFHRSW